MSGVEFQILCPKCRQPMNRRRKRRVQYWFWGLYCDNCAIAIQSNYPIIDRLPVMVEAVPVEKQEGSE